MGVLDRFERGIDRVVNGAFARAFRSQVEPVELASALRREADNRAAVVSRGRTLTANAYAVELSSADHERRVCMLPASSRAHTTVLLDQTHG